MFHLREISYSIEFSSFIGIPRDEANQRLMSSPCYDVAIHDGLQFQMNNLSSCHGCSFSTKMIRFYSL